MKIFKKYLTEELRSVKKLATETEGDYKRTKLHFIDDFDYKNEIRGAFRGLSILLREEICFVFPQKFVKLHLN